ncbi:MAG: hypothetical protein IPJ88_12710 [Myxococcales bacterium]|nr:MAG: hypothetical protein IPJ88_12710 [Myxococcales bacterium]
MTKPVTIKTKVGFSDLEKGENWYFGYPVLAELAGRTSLTGLSVLASHGKQLSLSELRVIDDIATVNTTPDPRIWPLKLVRLVASYGHTLPAFACISLGLESVAIGPWEYGTAAEFLLVVDRALGDSEPSDSAIKQIAQAHMLKHGRLPGFGVPMRPVDERVPVLRKCLLDNSMRHEKRYWKLFERLSLVVRESFRIQAHISGASAAAMLDIGLSPRTISLASVLSYQHVFMAHADEGAQQSLSSLCVIELDKLEFNCPEHRVSDRKKKWLGA